MSDRPLSSAPAVCGTDRVSGVADRVLTAVVLVALGYEAVDIGITGSVRGFPGGAPWALLLLCCGVVAAVVRRRRPATALVVGAACWTLLAAPWVIALVLYDSALHPPASRRRAVALRVFGVLALGSRLVLPDPLGLAPTNIAFWTVACGALPVAVGLWLAARRGLLASLREQLARAEASRAVEVAAARTAERSRIAGEMHDVVAHRVSLMVLHAGALEVSGGEAVAEQAALIRRTGRTALEELRAVLGLLHSAEDAALAPQPTLERLDELVRSSREAGTGVLLAVEGVRGELSPAVERTAYRVVQEALTNVHKHAPGARATVRLRHGPDVLEVSVRNTRPAGRAADRFPSSGHGLVGLRERVTLAGGALTTGPLEDGGFLVTAELPCAVRPGGGERAA
ncbi:sensor histidine kinase [Kitasatospora sp. NPDC101176]|uniref:sensor histidine kinase n=1 Tax=Kitasatospora sp. NPDC101176 TaxID=3364099 RepID=UPI00380AD713